MPFLLPAVWMLATPTKNLKLTYDRPATKWVEALPVGNGRLGAMVFGGVSEERLQLNEDSLWSGGPQDADNPEALKALPEIRRLLFAGKYREAQELTYQKLTCKGPGTGFGNGAKVDYGSYQTLGDLHLKFALPPASPDHYRRELDLDTATARTEFTIGAVRFTREVFASQPANALVIRLTASTRAALSFTVSLDRPEAFTTVADGTYGLHMLGRLSAGKGMKYSSRLQVISCDGTRSIKGNQLEISGANKVVLELTAATDYRGGDPAAATLASSGAAVKSGYERLRKDQLADYQKLFRRVSLSLRVDKDAETNPDLTTTQRLDRIRKGESDPYLATLYFQYGRYLLISCSRPGGLAANLQGLWNDHLQAPWNADYHHNINDQMNYWPAESTNLAECHEPFLDFIGSLTTPGYKTAQVHYGAQGWVVHTISNVWGYTSPGEHPSWGQFPAAGAWLCRHLWEHYLYAPDPEFLKRVWPTMKGSAEFYLDFLVTEPKNGYLVTAPSNSPENAFRTADGQTASVCYGPTMDNQIIRELFTSCIEAAKVLKRDSEFVSRLEAARRKLPPNQIGRNGRLKEWIEDFDETEPGHRHMSHLYGLYPGDQISVRRTPELAAAALKSLEGRLAGGGGHTGWSRAWIINFWARLGNGNKALENYTALLAKSTLPNLFDDHPPFQIDGNFGATAGVAEMLLQSDGGEIQLLPTLPDAWRTGRVTGLKARGDVTVDIEWIGGKLRTATLKAGRDCVIKIVKKAGWELSGGRSTLVGDVWVVTLKKNERCVVSGG